MLSRHVMVKPTSQLSLLCRSLEWLINLVDLELIDTPVGTLFV